MHSTYFLKESVSEMPDTNPYESPTLQSNSNDKDSTQQARALLKLEKKAKKIGNAAEMAILVGITPVLGLLFIPHLVQWYMLRSSVKGNQLIDLDIRNKFSRGITYLWIGVLLWPMLVIILTGYIATIAD